MEPGVHSGPAEVASRAPAAQMETLQAIAHQIALARATELARRGRYADAEHVLSDIPSRPDQEPTRLDLVARIRAQQGRLREAEELWTAASRLDGGNASYRAALERLGRIQRSARLTSVMRLALGVGIAVALAIGLRWGVRDVRDSITRTVESVLKSQTERLLDGEHTATTQLAAELRRSVSELGAALRTDLAAKAPAPPLPLAHQPEAETVKVALAGITVRAEGADVVLTFDSGLFFGGTVLKPEAKELLTALGQQLAAHIGHIVIRVVGCVDDTPMPAKRPYRDNIALGMARAVTVVEHLRATTELPANSFSVASVGESLAPFPNDTPDNRARNRTVLLRISDATP